MLKKPEKQQIRDLLFFGALGLFLLFTVLSTGLYYSMFRGMPFNIMYLVIISMLCAYELLDFHYTLKDWIWGGLGAGLFLISFLVADGALQRSIPCIFVFVFCARKLSFDRVARFALIWTSVLACFVALSGYFGLVDNHVVSKNGRVRDYMGFRYALFPAAHLLNITALYVWLHRKKLPLIGAGILAALNVWVYLKTDSRFSFVFSLLLLGSALILRYLPGLFDKLRCLRWAMVGAFPLCALASVVMTLIYNPEIGWMRQLNGALSGRLNLGHKALEKYGMPLFGMTVDWVGNGLNSMGQQPQGTYDYVDCVYVNNLINFGPIFSVICLVLLTWAMVIACRKKMDLVLIIMSTVAVHLILDDLSMYLYYNTFWFLMGQLLLDESCADRLAEETPPQSGSRRSLFRPMKN